MTTLNKYWEKEKTPEQTDLEGYVAEIPKENTLRNALKGNKEERELFERNAQIFKTSEMDTVKRINEHGFFEARLRTDHNLYDVLDIELALKEENASKVAIAYADNEWRPSATNKNMWDSAHPQFPFRQVHVPVEKCKYFKIEKNRSFYIVRSPNHEDGIGFVISGKYIVDSYNRGIVDRVYPTRMGERTFVLVERDKGESGRFNTMMNYIIASLCEENSHVREKYDEWL